MKRFNRHYFQAFWQKITPNPFLPLWRRNLQWVLIGVGGATLAGGVFTLLVVFMFSFGLPDLSKGDELLQAQSTLIMDRKGNILYALHGEENRKIVSLKNISPYLLDASIAVEDDEFYDHWGFDVPCLSKAVAHEIFGVGIRRGCSTITQQLAKNIFLAPEQTYTRKIQELILSIKMELRFNKEEILELYLNEIPYGNNAYGVEMASQRYFNKPASELTLTESAILASLPKAPTRYSPYGTNKNSYLIAQFSEEQLEKRTIQTEEDLEVEEYFRGLIGSNIVLANGTNLYIPGRTDIVLNSMLEQGMITEEEKDMAKKESWALAFQEYHESIEAPHFVLYVKELLEEKYGKDVIEQGGLKVYTTLDPDLQNLAEEKVEKYRERNGTNFNATNASLVSIQPQTGQIVAMVGSADYWDPEIDGNVNIALRLRQPGSSFKPFVYALSFLNGYAPATVLYDVATEFGPGQWPKNYDGTFKGPVSMRYALGHSLNIPAIKAYFLAGQEEAIIPFMEKFGIELDSSIGYGWPLALGTGEVRLLDFVGAYTVFANNGIKKEISPILKIENSKGEVLEQWEDKQGKKVLDPQAAYLVNSVLSDRSVNLGPRLNISGQTTAVKTGTSTKKESNGTQMPSNTWTMGYTTKLVTGVWVGNADGSSMNYMADGYNTAAPIWNEFMTGALATVKAEDFPKPKEIVEVAVSRKTGLLPSKDTTDTIIEQFASFNVPTKIENNYVTLKIDKMTRQIANEYSPGWSIEEKNFFVHRSILSTYPSWQRGIDAWTSKSDIEKPPTETDSVHTAETLANSPSVVIVDPTAYSRVEGGTREVEVDISAGNGVERVEFYLGETLQFVATQSPYDGEIRFPINAKSGTKYDITAYVYDVLGYRNSSMISVQVSNEENSDKNNSSDLSTEAIDSILEESKPEEDDIEDTELAN